MYRKVGDTKESITHLLEAVRIAVGTSKAATFNNLALSYFDAENFYEALIWFEKAKAAEEVLVNEVKGDSGDMEDYAFYLNNIGLCHYHLARPVEEDEEIFKLSIKFYDMAIKNW
jgi:tetratricopeptide (TPR) repeat protein